MSVFPLVLDRAEPAPQPPPEGTGEESSDQGERDSDSGERAARPGGGHDQRRRHGDGAGRSLVEPLQFHGGYRPRPA